MNGREIADELGVSRMMVSVILKRAVTKLYRQMQITNKHLNSFEVCALLQEILNIQDESDVKAFYRMLPNDVKEDIKNNGRKKVKIYESNMY